MKVFLGDLVHTWEKVSVWTMPLNIGFIGAYARAHVPEISELRLFKRPERMIEAIKLEKPDVVGFTHYVWNTNLNSRVADIARKANPDAMIVGGGPQFTSINANAEGAGKFFARRPSFDAYVVNQGERGFVELLKTYIEEKQDISALRRRSVAGCLMNASGSGADVLVGEQLDTLRDLDEIPSPYLSGMLDEFFDEPLNPMIETNRSCPYRCTFCAWGIGTDKLARFSTERVMAEIDYIAQRCTKATTLHICDANFGILERDAEIAARIYQCHLTAGFPGLVSLQWNKTRPDRTGRVAMEFRGIADIGASMQSFNPATLDAIKRRNLPLADVAKMIDRLEAAGIKPGRFSELILGLPEETWESHVEANKALVDMGFEVHNYNLHLLPGTEMDTRENRSKYVSRTGWRLHDNCFGVYDGAAVFEGQEVVLETPTMSRADFASFRYIHWLVQLMWGRRYYLDYLHLLWKQGSHPIDTVVAVYEAMKGDKGEIGDVYRAFTADYGLENFDTEEELYAYWATPEHLERLRSGDYGKLNAVYSHQILLHHVEAFNEFLYKVAERILTRLAVEDREDCLVRCREILRFNAELRITLTDDLELVDHKKISFESDILAWKAGKYSDRLPAKAIGAAVSYEFYIPREKHSVLETRLQQYRSHNMNMTWRKMTEYATPDQFFYDVRRA